MPFSRLARSRIAVLLPTLAFLAGLTGCGNSSGTICSLCGTPPPLNTTVMLTVTSTANDQLTYFGTTITSITLESSSGSTVPFFSATPSLANATEWMHLNGAAEPFATASVPAGTYTAATVTLAGCVFTNVTYTTTLTIATYAQGTCNQGTGTTTVRLPSPIKIQGTAMALSLDLQVGSSWTLEPTQPIATYTVTPTFTLSPLALAATPTNLTNGLLAGVNGQITAVNTDPVSATITLADQLAFTVKPSPSATYQGLSGFSALAANQIVNMDLAIQPDGSLAATRVEIDDPAATFSDIGWFLTPDSPQGTESVNTTEPLGCGAQVQFPVCYGLYFVDSQTTYGVSGEFTNLSNLPFTPAFSPASFTQGQKANGLIAGNATKQGLPYVETLTLQPQTLNGTVQSISNVNGIAVYTISLAPYDLFPVTQLYASAFSPLITTPTMVEVYADQNTQFLNTGMVEAGQTLRFRGVVFNDSGTLQMDCNLVLDGVTE